MTKDNTFAKGTLAIIRNRTYGGDGIVEGIGILVKPATDVQGHYLPDGERWEVKFPDGVVTRNVLEMDLFPLRRVFLLKDLPEAPEGCTYVGGSMAYWQYSKDNAFKCYDLSKWTHNGKKMPVRVFIAPDHESTAIHQGGYVTSDIEFNEYCGCIAEFNMENNG